MDEKELEKYIEEVNNTPTDRLSGLSPSQVHDLIHNPFSKEAVIQFGSLHNDVLNQIPFFRLCKHYLEIIQREGSLKLTPSGALQKKICLELYDSGIIKEWIIESGIYKLAKEENVPAIVVIKSVCLGTGLTRKASGKIHLTKKGEKLLTSDESKELFLLIFFNFTQNFNWGYFDGYPDVPIGEYGYCLSVYLLLKYAEKESDPAFYAHRYLNVLYKFLEMFDETTYMTREEQFTRCYTLRNFERFMYWFGLVEMPQVQPFRDEKKIISTDFATLLFTIKKP